MLFKSKSNPNIDEEQIKLVEDAQKRVKQRKRLFYHFSVMLFGIATLLIINILFKIKGDIKPYDIPWSYWVSIFWILILLAHAYNVYITNRFMGKDWEKEQIKKLVLKQELKISKIKNELEKEARIKAESELFKQNNYKNLITLIAAVSENNVIGKDNKLIWYLSDDLKHFKELTKGHAVIMGRKTFESMPKALPNRTNIVITRKTDYVANDAIVVNSLNQALEKAVDDKQPFIIGGGEIYSLAIKIADRIELTRVHTDLEGDAYFPEIDHSIWEEVSREKRLKDEKHDYDFTFVRYNKK
ncbi:MAG: dihydrofolate reductase [Bacteroidetes bacterium]|jgi:dihydrofolate reductase|nr:dihydrofolate reductase [Bacteroidota bacterium]MDA1018750.1 dihydrofolate reductase [Bacteroidota bacterium]